MNQYDRSYDHIAREHWLLQQELVATRSELAKVRSKLTEYQDRAWRAELAFIRLERVFGLLPHVDRDPGQRRRIELATHYKGSPESYMIKLYGVSTQ